MKVKIYFRDEQSRIATDLKLTSLLRRAIMTALKHESVSFDAEISVTFTDNNGIHKLNREYRGKDSPTDVLSFPMVNFDDDSDTAQIDFSEENFIPLGDIVLSFEKAAEQAEEFGHSFERECAFLCVHSVLHLLGYDHEISAEDDENMRRIQREIMKRVRL